MAQFNSNPSPHIRCEDSTRSLMLDVLIALCPSFIWGFYVFGLRAALLLFLSIASCVLLEWLVLKLLRGRAGNVSDLSAAVTGAILASLMPVAVPLWMAPLAAFLAIVIVKHLFGGSPNNRLNPALTSLAILYFLFPEHLTRLSQPFVHLPAFSSPKTADASVFEVARPLQQMASGTLPTDPSASLLLTGSVAGGMASTSVLLLAAGALYLLVRRVISWHIPTFSLATVAVLSLVFVPEGVSRLPFMTLQLLSGALVFCVIFAATDPVTSPITGKGKIVFAVLLGALTYGLRTLFSTEGVGFAILLASLTSRFWDYLFRPRVYGMPRNLVQSFQNVPGMFKPTFLKWKARFERLFASVKQMGKRESETNEKE